MIRRMILGLAISQALICASLACGALSNFNQEKEIKDLQHQVHELQTQLPTTSTQAAAGSKVWGVVK